VSACAKPPAPATPLGSNDERAPANASGDDSLAVTGLRGTLSQHEIQGALEPRLPKLLRCVQTRLPELEALSGTISFVFNVAVNGSVDHVRPSASTLGDRETERCMLALAAATRFPAPHGGEAEFTWPLEIPIDSEVRAPVELAPDFARPLLASEGEALHARCGGGQLVVTAYLDTEGQVLAAGTAAPDLATDGELDCVAEGVRAWRFPSPGSYLGKLSFTLP
jgi:hypothetical protein